MNIYLVYQKFNRDFIAYAKSITNNSDRAFDLAQEAYVSAIEHEEIFDRMNEYQIKGWFFTTIKNKNIDYIRKYSRLTHLENDEYLGNSEDFEECIVMRELLNKLPEKNRKILLLRYNMNFNSKEIGEILGIPSSTVRSRLSAALKLLKENL